MQTMFLELPRITLRAVCFVYTMTFNYHTNLWRCDVILTLLGFICKQIKLCVTHVYTQTQGGS